MKMRVAAIILAGLLAPALAQEGLKIKRTPLGTIDSPPGYQTVMGFAELERIPIMFVNKRSQRGSENSCILRD
jgi:hypothetical protein